MNWRALLFVVILTGSAAAQETRPPADDPAVKAQEAPTVQGPTVAPAKRELVMQVIAIIDPAKLTVEIESALLADLERRYPQILEQVVPGHAHPEEGPEKEAHDQAVAESFQRVAKRFRVLYAERIQIARILEEIYVPLYDKFYTEAELQDLLAFYRTPTGAKTLRITTQLVQEAMEASNAMLMPQLLGILQEVMEEEKAAWPKPELPGEHPPGEGKESVPPPASPDPADGGE
jgi:hypothetical protein